MTSFQKHVGVPAIIAVTAAVAIMALDDSGSVLIDDQERFANLVVMDMRGLDLIAVAHVAVHAPARYAISPVVMDGDG